MQTRFLRLLTISLILMLPTGCYHNDKNDLTEEESLVVKINLTVPNAATGTRAATEPGNAAENYIDVDGDYHVLIFDKAGVMADVVKMEECEITSEAGSLTTYTLSGKMTIPDEATRARLKTFQMMVLANWKSFDESSVYPTFPPTYPEGGTVSRNDFYTKDAVPSGSIPNSLCFTMPQRSETAWQPGIDGQKHLIPMFGISDPISLDYAIEMGKYGDSPITSISMLRSIAKVEIVDNTSSGITGITLSKSNQYGRFIPDLGQAANPSLPGNKGEIENLNFLKGLEQVQIDGVNKNVWFAYIPEMAVSSKSRKENGYEEKRPEFILQFADKDAVSVKFDNYTDEGKQNTANQLQSVLRNHIYRYTINESPMNLEVMLEVLYWNLHQENEIFFDNVKVDQEIRWKLTKKDEEGNDVDNGVRIDGNKVYMMTGTDDCLEATFKLTAPIGAKWSATLISLNQDHHDSFEFVGPSSDVIDGETAQTIRIKNLSEKVYDENNEARLVITVEYPDKTQKEIYITGYTEFNNYIIIQERTEIMG